VRCVRLKASWCGDSRALEDFGRGERGSVLLCVVETVWITLGVVRDSAVVRCCEMCGTNEIQAGVRVWKLSAH